MSDDDRPTDGAPPEDSGGSAAAPWERAWAARDADADPAPPRHAVDDAATVTVADLLRRSGAAEGAGTSVDAADTAVIPVVRDPAPDPAADPGPVIPTAAAGTGDEVAVPTRLQTKRTRRHRRAAVTAKVAVALVATTVLGVTGSAWGALHYVDSTVRQVDALDTGSTAIQQPAAQLGDENFLLVGSDSRAGASGDVGAGSVQEVQGARSDTTMIAHIPADRSRIVIVSFPRDLQVDLPECQGWDSTTGRSTATTHAPRTGVKLNEAFFEGGPKCTTKVVQQLSGLSVNHFLGVDFSGFESVVDAVGGVQVCTEAPLRDTFLGDVLPKAGTSTLTGAQALNYVRARHVIGDPTSDYGRIQRQQRFLASLLRASLSSDTLLNVGKLKKLVDAVTASTFGEGVGVEELLTLAQSLDGLQPGRVTFVTAPTTGTANAAGNEVLRADTNAALFQAVRDGAPLPGEAAAAPTSAAPTTPAPPPPPAAVLAVAPSTVTLRVVNATGTARLAATVATELGTLGWTVAGTGNESGAVPATVVRYSTGHEAAAATVASSVPGATTVLTPGLGAEVELVLATDVRGTLVAPTAAGTALASGAAAATAAPTTAPAPKDLTVVNGGDTTCS